MPQRISQFVLAIICWSLTPYSGQGLHAEVHLKILDNRVCIGEQFHLSCEHPDLANASAYLHGSPVWREDGSILTLDGKMYTHYLRSRRKTILNVFATLEQFANTSHTYTCSVIEAIPGSPRGQTITSNTVSVHPIGQPQTPTFNNVETGISTANVSWSHNSTCFEECQFEYMLSVAIGTDGHHSTMQQNIPYWIIVNNTQHLLSNLYSGTTYVVTLNAFCTTKGVWSVATSTTFTTVSFKQRTEGMSALPLAGTIAVGAVLLGCIILTACIIGIVHCCKGCLFSKQRPPKDEEQVKDSCHVQMQDNPCYAVIHQGPEEDRNEDIAHMQMVENPSYVYNTATLRYQNACLHDKPGWAIYGQIEYL